MSATCIGTTICAESPLTKGTGALRSQHGAAGACPCFDEPVPASCADFIMAQCEHPDLAAVAADPQIAKLNTGASSTVKSSPSDMSLRNCMNHLYTRLRLRRVIEITSAEFRIQNATGPPP
jgi:hypothetical protein